MSEAKEYGNIYYGVKTKEGQTRMFYADEVVCKDGNLIASRKTKEGENQVTLAFAKGEWVHLFTASIIDGRALCIVE